MRVSNGTGENPHRHDPDLIKEAADDQALLDRLVAREQARTRFMENPNDESARTLFESMDLAVREYREREEQPEES